MHLQPFFKWMESLAVYKSSIYLGPGVNLVHLVSMATFMGAASASIASLDVRSANAPSRSVKAL